jgi:hypothetical protein
MKLKPSTLKRIIQEEIQRAISERVNLDTFKVSDDQKTFSVMADPTKEEEGTESEEITGRIERYKGRALPKADPENLPFGYESLRSVSGQLSAQLRPIFDEMFGAVAGDTIGRQSKGRVLADALQAIAEKYPDDEDVQAAIGTILGVKLGFDIPYSVGAEEVEEEVGW